MDLRFDGGSGTGVSSHSAWNAANDCGYVCNLYQVNQCLDQRQKTTRKPDDCHARRMRTDNGILNLAVDLVHGVSGAAQRSTSNVADQCLAQNRKKKMYLFSSSLRGFLDESHVTVASEPPQRRVQARLATVMGQPVPTSDVQNPKEQTTSHTIGQPLRQRRKRNRGADDSNTRRRKSSSDCTSASPNTIHVPGEACGSHFSKGHMQKRKSSSNCTSSSPNTIHVPAEASTSHVNEVNRPRFDDNSAKPYDKRRSSFHGIKEEQFELEEEWEAGNSFWKTIALGFRTLKETIKVHLILFMSLLKRLPLMSTKVTCVTSRYNFGVELMVKINSNLQPTSHRRRHNAKLTKYKKKPVKDTTCANRVRIDKQAGWVDTQVGWVMALHKYKSKDVVFACGSKQETPEPFPLPKEVLIVRAAAGWAHCVCVTVAREVYTWGWKECVPSGKVIGDRNSAQSKDNDLYQSQNSFLTEQAKFYVLQLALAGSRATGVDGKAVGDETTKRRRVSSAKKAVESSSSGDDPFSAFPCLVALNPG
ncbi:regulator of chromosome condensation 1/beta-lactamase-inhibitor protein II [Artemisia annua]|uniref:Regulator of chromosome condensation 1/beta-lactamase-inhibitor protein II n=1 Tax=Artemisia annua TaxID=35608 RepID=A0A2U1MSK0_ARTAN|nr:regulator of chromosome condensation 1/beta-lactamase-inhibitor protein II [Artemisia annua]